MYDKQGLYDLLDEKGIEYEAIEHGAVYTMEEMEALGLPHNDRIAKNLFLRDEKKRNYYVIVLKGDKAMNIKALREKIGAKPLSFGSEPDLMKILGLEKGAVTPFGALNDSEKKTIIYLDKDFQGGLMGIHPNDNTATVFIKAEDLAKLLKDDGHKVNFLQWP